MSYIFTRDAIEDVEAMTNTRALKDMTLAEVMLEDVEEYDGYTTDKWEERWNEECSIVKCGESKGYDWYDEPRRSSGSDIIANLQEYALALDSEIVFERTSVMNTVYSDAAGCRIEATEFAADGTVTSAKDYVLVFWKGKGYKVNKSVAFGRDKDGAKIMGFDIEPEDLI